MAKSNHPASPSRRKFLKRTGWTALGLTVLAGISVPVIRDNMPALPTFSDPEANDALSWVQVLPDGTIRFYCPRAEMGQGANLGLAQAIAEELNIEQAAIQCVYPDTNQVPPYKMTVGSESILIFLEPVARAAATIRETLRQRAASEFNISIEELSDHSAGFSPSSGESITYAELAGNEPMVIEASSDPHLKLHTLDQQREKQAVGKAWKHHELQAIVTGNLQYSRDASLPDMLYGDVLRPPFLGAKLLEVDSSQAEAMPSVTKVVIEREAHFVGVIVESPFVLDQALAAISVKWEDTERNSQEDIEQLFQVDKHQTRDDFPHTIVDKGSATDSESAAKHIRASYTTPYMAHSPMEPRAAVVSVTAGAAEIWCGSQDPYFVRGRVAKILGLAPEAVVVHPLRMGGGFGGRIQCQPSEEAARLSAAIGKPVRVQWSRETEMAQNYFQPYFSHYLELASGQDGQLSHWQHDMVTSPILLGPMSQLLGSSGLSGTLINTMDTFVADEGSTRGALAQYLVPNQRVRFSSIRNEVPTGAWRGLGAGSNAFAIESALDELAAAIGIDPVEFRLQNLPKSSARLAKVLKRAAQMANWGRKLPANSGLGIACAAYKDLTPVAVVAEVKIDDAQRAIQVVHLWCAHDCGQIINPDQVENLIEGNMVWGCNMALKEQITLQDGAIAQQNFHNYPILRHHEMPEVTIELIQPLGEKPVGVGESALPPVIPAIANAVFAAIGKRLRSLPMSYQQLQE